jgi:hypothetical protein
MSSSRRPFVIAALVVLAALLWWLALSRRDGPDDALPGLGKGPVELSPFAGPRAPTPPGAPRDTEPIEPVEPVEPSPAVPAPPAEEAVEQPMAAAPIPPDTRGFVDALAQSFDGAPRASDAGAIEGSIRRLFRGDDVPSGMLRAVLCRQAVCKLELRWTAEHDAAYQRAMNELISGNAKNLATRAEEPDQSGAVRVDAYWLRAAWHDRATAPE